MDKYNDNDIKVILEQLVNVYNEFYNNTEVMISRKQKHLIILKCNNITSFNYICDTNYCPLLIESLDHLDGYYKSCGYPCDLKSKDGKNYIKIYLSTIIQFIQKHQILIKSAIE